MTNAHARRRFRVIRPLGAGGMGIVDEVLDEERGMRVARKTLSAMSPEALAQFKREFRAAQDLSHPNLVTLHELMCLDDEWFFTMELVEGSDLLPWLRTARRRADDDDAPPSTQRAVPCDERRLRSALAQLTSGLAALHAAGLIHRDVKPSNVRVDENGRVVLLDFGLALPLDSEGQATDMPVAGTPEYMAPEQAVGRLIGPEADFYALGVLLYEALTERVPFEGAPLEVLLRKQREEPQPAKSLVPGVPPDLDRLCSALLAFDPKKRPDARGIQRALGVTNASVAPSHSGVQATPFVGRVAELEALTQAFDERARGRVVVLAGESGIGKSCLVRRFLELAAATEPHLVVLSGRCHEHEAVPYKAFDGVVDALARFLKQVPKQEVGAYMPTRPGPLVQVFPVLRRVEAIAALPLAQAREGQPDPMELRSRAFAALRDLLVRVADQRPVVITIDDLQWADAESLALLRDLLRPPDSPPLLLVATVRSSGVDPSDAEVRVRQAILALHEPRLIDLTRLLPEQARELAARLLLRAGPDRPGDPEAIALEAEGHPLYIDALVRHAMVATGESLLPPRLEDAIGEQVRSLDPHTRRVLELVAVAGAPIGQSVLSSAADVAPEEFARAVSFLRVAHLASITGARGADTIEAYHDKVRVAVLAGIDAPTRHDDHRRLAVALEASGAASLESLATHWFAAGDPARGAEHAERAGDEAASALAFDHAASFYARALHATEEGAPLRLQLGEKLGNALANAGRSVPAAAAFQTAARLTSPAHALELRRRAVEQLLRGGRFDAGFDALRDVLTSIGARLPRTPLAAVFAIVLWRLYLRVRGLAFRARDVREITQKELTKVDVCWSIAMTLSFTDNVRGAAFSARNVALALRCGHPPRVARALALDVGYVASGERGSAKAEAQRERARDLAERAGDAYAMAWVHASGGLTHWLHGRYTQAYDDFVRAEALFGEKCTGVAWELATVRAFILNVLCYRGDLTRLLADHPVYLRDALDRGDLYTAGSLRTALPGLYWLVLDQPDEARRQLAEAEQGMSSRGFHVGHSRALNMHVFIDLYEGRAAEALARTDAQWAAVRRSLLLRVTYVRTSMLYLRACTRITLATGDRAPRALLATAAREAKIVAAASPGRALGRVVEASVAAARGEDELADRLMTEATADLEASSIDLFATAALRARGVLFGGAEGAKLVDRADAWFVDRGVVRPDRFARCLVPQLERRTGRR
jgi:tetratricopeptide (TPR) repeat protein